MICPEWISAFLAVLSGSRKCPRPRFVPSSKSRPLKVAVRAGVPNWNFPVMTPVAGVMARVSVCGLGVETLSVLGAVRVKGWLKGVSPRG